MVASYAASEQWPTFGGNLLNPFGRPGVFFFSLDAASLPAVLGARAADKLPYLHAAMVIRSDGREFHYSSSRLQSPWPAGFHARYQPVSPPRQREKNSIEFFLTERYCLYAVDKGMVLRAYIHHAPWPLVWWPEKA